MPSFVIKKFKKPTKGGSEDTVGFANAAIDALEQKLETDGFLSNADLQQLGDYTRSWADKMDTPTSRQSVTNRAGKYDLQKVQRDNRGLSDNSFYQTAKKDGEVALKYASGNKPKEYLDGLAAFYDDMIGKYATAIDQRSSQQQDVSQYLTDYSNLIEQRNEIGGMISDVKNNVDKKEGRVLDNMGIVIVPDANGGIADISLLPSRKIRGAFRTDVMTDERIPVYVVPNQRTAGKNKAVIGNYTFEETGGLAEGLLGQKLGQLSGSEEISDTGTAGGSTNKIYKLTSGNFDPKNDPIDLSNLSMTPNVPDGDYLIGRKGIYRKMPSGGFQRLDSTVQNLGVDRTRYRYIDQSLEDNMIAPQANEYVGPDAMQPENFGSVLDHSTSSMPLSGTSTSPEPAPEDTEPQMTGQAPNQPAQKQKTGLGGFIDKAKSIFGGAFNQQPKGPTNPFGK